MMRLDPSKPADLAKLIATGLIWNAAVPVQYKQMALDALANGTVEVPDNLPKPVLDQVNEMRNGMGLPPLEVADEPETPDGPAAEEAGEPA